MIRGGCAGRGSNGRLTITRPVKAVGEDIRLNTALWTLTQKTNEILTRRTAVEIDEVYKAK